MCGPNSTHNEAPTLKQRFFVITITKTKRFFMGVLVGALFTINTNKTNNKQHLNRRYDSESGTTNLKKPAYGLVFCFSTAGLFIELRSIIRRQRLTPTGPARQARCSTPTALVRVRAPNSYQRTSTEVRFCILHPPKYAPRESSVSTEPHLHQVSCAGTYQGIV